METAEQKTAQFSAGAISTSHHLATEAGAKALQAGGTAIDAALAAAATLCVVYPNNVALGGDLVAIVRSPEGQVRFLNATGPAPAAQTLAALQEKHGAKLPLRGIDTVTVPGGVCGWNSLHEYGAKLSWESHFIDAIKHAEDGFENSRSVAKALISDRATLEKDPGARAVFYPDGNPVVEGETLRQPALARTLRALSKGGSAEFYTGATAKKWIAGLARLGSKITLQDADEYAAVWEEPLAGEFAGRTVYTSPPNTSGFMLLRALNAIAGVGGEAGIADPLGNGAGALAETFAAANAVRAKWLADPRYGAKTGAALITMGEPAGAPGPENATGDTVGLSAVSADGWAISLVNSIYWGFGAHILEPETGIIFQNRGTAFSLETGHPNAFAPGKRPRHTLMPVMILKDGALEAVPATMGGSGQPQIHAQLLLRTLAGDTPQQAIDAPRWQVRDADSAGKIAVRVESDVTQSVLEALQETGYEMELTEPHSEGLGHSNLIVLRDGQVLAASDPRSDGAARIVTK